MKQYHAKLLTWTSWGGTTLGSHFYGSLTGQARRGWLESSTSPLRARGTSPQRSATFLPHVPVAQQTERRGPNATVAGAIPAGNTGFFYKFASSNRKDTALRRLKCGCDSRREHHLQRTRASLSRTAASRLPGLRRAQVRKTCRWPIRLEALFSAV